MTLEERKMITEGYNKLSKDETRKTWPITKKSPNTQSWKTFLKWLECMLLKFTCQEQFLKSQCGSEISGLMPSGYRVLPGSLLKSVLYSERTLQQALRDICIHIPIWNTLFYTRIQHRMSTSFSESTNVDCWSVVSHIGIPRTMSNRISSACLSPGPVLSVFFFQRRNQLKGFCRPVLAAFVLFYFVEVVLLVAQLT